MSRPQTGDVSNKLGIHLYVFVGVMRFRCDQFYGAVWLFPLESFNGRLRDECLNVEWFSSLDDARAKLARFRTHYNRERPHSALADRTPAAFAELHRSKEKSSTLMGRAKTASTAGERTYTAQNL
jgi:hypothetical protein